MKPTRAAVLALCVGCAADLCTKTEAEFISEQFNRDGGLWTTRCPDAVWLHTWTTLANDEPSRCLPDRAPRALIVGGNKGFDCAGWASLLAGGGRNLSKASWATALDAALLKIEGVKRANPNGACGQGDLTSGAEYPTLLRAASQQTPPEPAVTCVEALPSNSAVLVAAASAVPWRAHLRVVAAAATSAAHAGTMSLPSGLAFGIEQIGFQNRDHRASDHAFADVRAVTVDELVREDLGGHVPLVLTIDTEGSDALVLEGARTTLAR